MTPVSIEAIRSFGFAIRKRQRSTYLCFVVVGTIVGVLLLSPMLLKAQGLGKIVFVSNRDGNNEIYVMNADGTNQTRLTANSAVDKDPAWSPNGTKIAFISNRSGIYEVYVMGADGSGQTRITTSTDYFFSQTNACSTPTWSPNGSQIAYSRITERWLSATLVVYDPDIWVMNSNGSGNHAVKDVTTAIDTDYQPSWSRFDSRIYFFNDVTFHIYSVASDGTGLIDLGSGGNPSASPIDGRLALDAGNGIFIRASNGSYSQLAPAGNSDPDWISDGSKIVFTSNRDGNNEIYLMNPNGTDQARLTNNSTNDSQPDITIAKTVAVRKLYQGGDFGDTPWGPLPFGKPGCLNGRFAPCTFRSSACVVTDLAMALNFVLEKDFGTGGLDFTPKTAHDYLLSHNGFDGKSRVKPTIVPAIVFQTPTTNQPFIWEEREGTSLAALSAALDSGYPVYVRVLNNQHGILVTEKEENNGVTRFKIADPGRRANVYLDDAYQNNFIIRGYIRANHQAPAPIPFAGYEDSIALETNSTIGVEDETRSLSVSTDENTELMIIDPLGRRTGFDPTLHQLVNEIPNSSYDNEFNLDPFSLDPLDSAPAVRSVSVLVPIPGTYQIVVSRLQSGSFELDFKRINRFGQLSYSTVAGNLSAGTSSTFSITYYPGKSIFDYDGDGKSDISVWRPSDGTWNIIQSQSQSVRAQGWGLSGDKLAPADFDGDGKTDLAVFRPSDSNWYIFNSSTNTTTVAGWGLAGDLPVPADYGGDGKADLAVYRPGEGKWYRRDSDGKLHIYSWGLPGDKPAPADFNGDGVADMTVFRPSEGKWYILNSGNASISEFTWGLNGDVPIPGDYSGDGKSDFAVFRPSNQTWYRIHSDTFQIHIITWGLPGDFPTPGDYDGDGRNDLAVFRPSNSTWFINSSTGGIYSQPFGLTGDIPVENAFVY